MLPFIDYILLGGGGSEWSQTDKTSHFTISSTGLTATGSGGPGAVRANSSRAAGKLYFEVLLSSTSGGNTRLIGIANSSYTLTSGNLGISNALSAGINATDGGATLWVNSSGSSKDFTSTFSSSDVAGIAVDIPNKLIYAHRNGTYPSGMNPSTNTGGLNFAFSGGVFPIVGQTTNLTVFVANFGNTPFTYSLPTGFSAWG